MQLPFKYILYKYQELDSTNNEALRLLNKKAIIDKTVIVANKQNAGKGRLGRDWESPSGNIYMTVVIENNFDIATSQLSFVMAVAVGNTLGDINFKYKWPNDILIEGKKVCGILLENHNNDYVIIGVGINVNNSPDYATYLNKFHKFDQHTLIWQIINNFESEKNLWVSKGFSEVRKKWLKEAWKLGEYFAVNIDGKSVIGKFLKIDNNGNMMLAENSTTHIISSASSLDLLL